MVGTITQTRKLLPAVSVYFSPGASLYSHEKAAIADVATMIAKLKGCTIASPFDLSSQTFNQAYLIPDETLLAEEAAALNIASEDDLFGGVVPCCVARTKAITHHLVGGCAARPVHWSPVFADRVRSVVPPGYTAFTAEDARIATSRLLKFGTIRLKMPLACRGTDQTVIGSMRELDRFLKRMPPKEFVETGLVIEVNLRPVTTLSIGQVTIDNLTIAYHGIQRTVANNRGQLVYGGSHLICARGGWDALDRLPLDGARRLAVVQARSYDQATSEYHGFLASRRNYDVGQGLDGKGQWRSGVFEASWRSGGASTAELMAMLAFAADPTLQVLEVSAVKEFGQAGTPPGNAMIHFKGDDPEDGPILRYTLVTRKFRQVA